MHTNETRVDAPQYMGDNNDVEYANFIQRLTNNRFFVRKKDGKPMIGIEYDSRLARAQAWWDDRHVRPLE